MWPRLGKITALVSVLASCFALLWQIQQFRKECADNVPLLKCVIQVLLPDPAVIIKFVQLNLCVLKMPAAECRPYGYVSGDGLSRTRVRGKLPSMIIKLSQRVQRVEYGEF